MDLRSIYISNGTGIFLLLILLYVSNAKTFRYGTEDHLFRAMMLGVMLGCSIEAFSYAIDGHLFPGSRILNYIANTLLYSINLLLPFCVLCYVDIGLYGNTKRIWEKYKPQIIIGAVMVSLNIVNFFYPINYSITDQNVYERRPFGYVYYFVILYYMITALMVTRRYEKENGTRAFFSITVFVLPILIGAGLQFMFYGLSLAWLSAAIGLVGLFMMQQNELAYIDALVDTYNRQYFDHVLSAWINRGNTFVGAMFDIDGFKSINDNYGHTEGDKALKEVTDLLKQSRTDGEWVFRFAGDEFIVLKRAESPDGLNDYLNKVSENLEEYNRAERPYRLSLSYGTSYFDAGSTDAFIKEMDHRMYEMKSEHHKAMKQADSAGNETPSIRNEHEIRV